VIAFIVRVHDAADGLAGVVELPGTSRTPFRSGRELIELMESWLERAAADDPADAPERD